MSLQGDRIEALYATMAPERVGKLVVLSVGHPGGFVEASQWMQLDQPERINELLLGFLRE